MFTKKLKVFYRHKCHLPNIYIDSVYSRALDQQQKTSLFTNLVILFWLLKQTRILSTHIQYFGIKVL